MHYGILIMEINTLKLSKTFVNVYYQAQSLSCCATLLGESSTFWNLIGRGNFKYQIFNQSKLRHVQHQRGINENLATFAM